MIELVRVMSTAFCPSKGSVLSTFEFNPNKCPHVDVGNTTKWSFSLFDVENESLLVYISYATS